MQRTGVSWLSAHTPSNPTGSAHHAPELCTNMACCHVLAARCSRRLPPCDLWNPIEQDLLGVWLSPQHFLIQESVISSKNSHKSLIKQFGFSPITLVAC